MSGVVEDIPEDFFPCRTGGWQRCFSEFSPCLCCKFFPVSLAEVRKRMRFQRRGRGVSGEGGGYGEVVGPKGVKSGPRRSREMPAQKGDIWRGGLALGGEASREILVRYRKLQTVDRPIEGLSSGRCSIIPCSGEPRGVVGIKVAKHHLVSTVLHKGVKVWGVVPGTGGRRADIHIEKVNMVPPRSVTTARTFAVLSSWNMSPSGTL